MKGPFHFLIGISTLAFASQPAWAIKPKLTPEAESAYLGKILKPIPDDVWSNVAGSKATEKYSVIKGDTLYDVSKRLFGDSKYWPKIWSLNNPSILNPHKILPGNAIAFSPGTGSALPSMTLNSSATDAPNESARLLMRSTEWKNLPAHQTWENFTISMPPEVDPLGFDRRSRVQKGGPTGFEPQAIPANEKIPLLGQVIGSRSEGQYLGGNDTVYIRADENLQVGVTYAITQEPSLLKSSKSDRVGYSYLILGKVKILGVRDHLFVGTITSARAFLDRGTYIINMPPKIPILTPIPGPKPIPGTLLVDRSFSTYTAAQHKEVFVDRGTQDGIQPGMIFRAYEHNDPSNDKKITDSDFIVDGDIMVTQVSDTFCTGIVISSKSPLYENSTVILLTDVSDLLKAFDFTDHEVNPVKSNDLDDLDKLDNDESLGKEEKRELKQLENWKGNPTEASPSPLPDPLPAPSDEPMPPPPAEATPDAGPTAEPPPPPTSEPPPPPAATGTESIAPSPPGAPPEAGEGEAINFTPPPPPPSGTTPPPANEPDLPPPPPTN